MNILIKNIKELVQVGNKPKLKVSGREMSSIETIRDAYLLISDGIIVEFGKMENLSISAKANGLKDIK
jgi:imidazolonepropionase